MRTFLISINREDFDVSVSGKHLEFVLRIHSNRMNEIFHPDNDRHWK